jgi:cell wall-associated NlpC family hydrolase
MQKRRLSIMTWTLVFGSLIGVTAPAHAAQSLAAVQAQVERLQIEATAAAEAGQQAQVELGRLTRSLNAVKQQDAVQAATMGSLKKSLGAIAVEQYKNNGLSQSMSLLFSSDPTLYLQAAGSLSVITQKKALQLHRYMTAEQRLRATSLTLNDQVAQVAAAKARYVKNEAAAQAKLKAAEKLLSKLTAADRIRLAKLQAEKDNAYNTSSLAFAKKGVAATGRGGIALRFALKQIGKRYYFGGAGMTYWDCSGLTMRAFGSAGASLPHSAAAQARYGKAVSLGSIRAGDLVFFGRPISHVGIYLGGGKMVDAPHSGARVRVESFGSRFGRSSFVAARRI